MHTVAEWLIKLYGVDIAESLLDEKSLIKITTLLYSNNTIACQINDLAVNMNWYYFWSVEL